MTAVTRRGPAAIFPYPGGKHNASALVWAALAGCQSYIEPMCGSAAVFLDRPQKLRFESINDSSGLVINFWRAVQFAPRDVYAWTQRPRSEVELVACARWLLSLNLAPQLKANPVFFDPIAAGVWAWYLSTAISVNVNPNEKQQPRMIRQGIHGERLREVLPAVLDELSFKLQDVRILCGDWKACLGPANQRETWNTDPIGVFLDPPYKGFELYDEGAVGISAEVAAWCLVRGTDPAWHIVLAGYANEHNLSGWRQVEWKTRGRVSGKHQEVLWLSPHCKAT